MKTSNKYRAVAVLLLIIVAAALFPEPNMLVFSERKYPNPKGVQSLLVIPVKFKDRGPSVPLDVFQNVLARMDDYFKEVSYGKISLEADMFEEWVELPHAMSYYGRDSKRPGDDIGGNGRGSLQIVYDAVSQVDRSIDFSKYFHLIVVHSGKDQAEESTDSLDDTVWSYSYWGISIPTRDSVLVTRVSIVSENSPLGVWVHEYLHQLGELPDLWSVNDSNVHYLGVWSPMDMGIALGIPRGSSPPHLSSWSKIKIGWLEPIILPLNDSTITISPIESLLETFQVAVMLPLPDGTYYLIEARERKGFDTHLPDEGVLIYHIDERGEEPKVRLVPREEDEKLKTRAAYRVGDSFYDEFNNLNIEVVSKSFHGYEVKVSVNQQLNLVIETPYRVYIMQPFDVTVKILTPSIEPKLNLFVDDYLYKTASEAIDGEYRIDVLFRLDQAGDHVVRAIVVDPEQGTRYEAARHIYVEIPYTWLLTTTILTIGAVGTLISFVVYMHRRGRIDTV